MSPIADTVAIVRHKHVTVSSQEISESNDYRLLRKHRRQKEPNGLRAPLRRRQRPTYGPAPPLSASPSRLRIVWGWR
jgi:hypothetical protein